MSEPDVSDLLTVAQAIDTIDAVAVQPRVVEAPLEEAGGRVLAQDIRADRDSPPFDKSMMDGYAVRCADVAHVPAELKVVGKVAAGQSSDRAVGAGEAIAIMTGAPIPAGADGVVPVEDVQRHVGKRGDMIRIGRVGSPQRFISPRGADVRANEIVLKRGMTLNPVAIAVAASVGAARLHVFARPRVAVLSTGDELLPIDQTPGPAQIRNSNSFMLIALLQRLGCEVTNLGIVRDTPEATHDALQAGMAYDVLFVTGGMSMGEYDYVPRTLLELGADLKITKLRIKPGKPFVFAIKGAIKGAIKDQSHFIFGLPGNPVAGFVCTIRLASRLIARLSGQSPQEKWIAGTLAEPLPANGPREFYQPVRVTAGVVHPFAWKGSADIFTLAQSNGLLVRPENEPPLAAGAQVRVLEL